MSENLKSKITMVKLSSIDEPAVYDRLEVDPEKIIELAQSIDEVGLLQPILLKPHADRYEIIAGHRRFLAVQQLGFKKVDAIIKNLADEEVAIARATENLAREDLTPVEQAAIFSNLNQRHNMTLEKIAQRFGYTPGTVRRRMDINKMPPVLRDALHKKRINVSVAEELWPISDLADLDYYLGYALDHGCTKDVARAWCKEWKDVKRRAESPGDGTPPSFTPNEPRPVYVSCDLCIGPMEIGTETVLRLCPECFKIIKQNM
jgi:ParB/RepB/Spo0J family partition protein